jgi:hypothetical protein
MRGEVPAAGSSMACKRSGGWLWCQQLAGNRASCSLAKHHHVFGVGAGYLRGHGRKAAAPRDSERGRSHHTAEVVGSNPTTPTPAPARGPGAGGYFRVSGRGSRTGHLRSGRFTGDEFVARASSKPLASRARRRLLGSLDGRLESLVALYQCCLDGGVQDLFHEGLGQVGGAQPVCGLDGLAVDPCG